MDALSRSDDYWDAVEILYWARFATERLAHAQQQIDAVNVFPVADHDTGQNMLATMRAGLAATENAHWMTAQDVAVALLQGVLSGARGNSGIILAQFWRAVALTLTRRRFDAGGYAEALATSVELIGTAVAEPEEGTAWSVLRAAAERAEELAAEDAGDLASVVGPVTESAVFAVARTPEQLPALAEAQVVDAGGLGVLCVLDALAEAVEEAGKARAADKEEPGGREAAEKAWFADAFERLAAGFSSARPEQRQRRSARPPRHEVEMELLDVDEAASSALRARLAEIGDSAALAGDGVRLRAHVHTEDAGSAVLAGIRAGRVVDVRITNLPDPETGATRAVLALAAGDGLAALFRDAGARVLVAGSDLTPEKLAEAVAELGPDEVFVLPNGALGQPELVRAASTIRAGGRGVRFLPCGAPAQGLAAIAVHDPGRPAGDDEYVMAVAAAGTRWGRLVVAREAAFTWAGQCAAGDYLGMVGEEVMLVSTDRASACADLVDLMLVSGGELVTALVGELGDAASAEALAEHMRKHHPGLELVVVDGGQTGEVVQVGVE